LIRAVLFDLDGTLLPIDTRSFLQQYTKALVKKVSTVMDPETFLQHLFYSTGKMVSDLNPNLTNKEVFWQHMSARTADKIDNLLPLLDDFYEREFPLLGENITPNRNAAAIVKKAKEKGYILVLATNPVFPEKAVIERMRWASLDPGDFDLITAYENMHFCKPHLEYYREVLDKIGESPGRCLMVGNDMEEDMVAGKIGVKTFLVEDFVINKNNSSIQCNYRGTLSELLALLESIKN